MKGILCAVIFLAVAAGQSLVPIPVRPLGHVYKGVPASAQIHIEFFIDLLCPDSKAAFPVLKEVGDHYGNSVRISTIQFPLPYHRNAFLAAMGVQVVHNMTNGNVNKVYEWMGLIFDNMDQFGSSVNFNVPENKTIGDFAAIAGRMGLSSSHFADLLLNERSMNLAVRVDWKYGCTRGIAGTPWFTVNGVLVTANENWTFADWKQLLDGILVQEQKNDEKSGSSRFHPMYSAHFRMPHISSNRFAFTLFGIFLCLFHNTVVMDRRISTQRRAGTYIWRRLTP